MPKEGCEILDFLIVAGFSIRYTKTSFDAQLVEISSDFLLRKLNHEFFA
jgi:hypothetical protein